MSKGLNNLAGTTTHSQFKSSIFSYPHKMHPAKKGKVMEALREAMEALMLWKPQEVTEAKRNLFQNSEDLTQGTFGSHRSFRKSQKIHRSFGKPKKLPGIEISLASSLQRLNLCV